MPVVFDSEEKVLKVMKHLDENNVFARRYFHPSLNELKAVGQYTPCPISEDISRRILALPSYHALGFEEIEGICELINSVLD
jgi:dTDP-4-amino-4,6-dideoxygalactose transaminase